MRPFENALLDLQNTLNEFGKLVNYNNKPRYNQTTPKVDVYEEAGSYYIEAELPGFQKENIKLSLEENVLTISGEKVIKRDNEKQKYYLTERSNCRFTRSFAFDDTIDTNNIEANFENGVLKIKIAKIEPIKPEVKTIEIK